MHDALGAGTRTAGGFVGGRSRRRTDAKGNGADVNATTAQPRYFDLGSTASYSRRRAGWFPGSGGGDARCGTLRLVMELEGRSADATEVDVYAVQEQVQTPPLPGVREFLLLNETDDSQDDVYGVTCVWGVVVKCTCRAGKCRLVCKHSDSINRLIAESLL